MSADKLFRLYLRHGPRAFSRTGPFGDQVDQQLKPVLELLEGASLDEGFRVLDELTNRIKTYETAKETPLDEIGHRIAVIQGALNARFDGIVEGWAS